MNVQEENNDDLFKFEVACMHDYICMLELRVVALELLIYVKYEYSK